ncbi:hypothetical protein AMAG_17936 [Allomyces macrogynus ATCC 38327]|uniref:Small GTP-binding protein domain n=1 Tax=Allomyces macrogynus (strain ATCC 38327) TaxID=578462 RepID=A0A0L0S2E7_ALLM3|nr:hypothetical protein AMAG_17936 [Allomyces macrogynus ATCC 38327]|eukprot:KNE56575.1 hypothetical protein AMAG_17936 [Allomyces macrogynus ATCC 38327]
MSFQRKPSPVQPSLPLQMLLSFQETTLPLMVVANLGSLAYKGWLLPYPSGAFYVEIVLAVLQLPIELLRLLFGSKGNLLESIPPLVVYFVLSLLTPFLSAFFMAWQTYVLAFDQWMHAVFLALSGAQFLMAVNLTGNFIDEGPEMGFMSAITASIGQFRSRQASLLVVGLDNAGKSTIVQYYKPESSRVPADHIPPTVGFHIDRFTRNHVQLTVFDMSGSARYRDLWPYNAAEGVAPFCHADCDLAGTMPAAEVAAILGLDAFKDRSCECSALTGQGLSQGMAWLIEQLSVAR